MPFVVYGKCADEFVVVQSIRKVGLVAGRAKLRGAVEVLHHGCGVALRMREDLLVGDFAGNALTVFVDYYRGHAENKAAISHRRLQFLNRVAGEAGQTVLIEVPIDLGILRQSSRQYSNGVVAAIAMAGELD